MTHDRIISVIGLGYVGLPVAVAFGNKSKVFAHDKSKQRIEELKKGVDSTNEVEQGELADADIVFSEKPEIIRNANFHIVAVPTPINNAKSPDLNSVISASKTVGENLKPDDIVVYESTVYPGATEDSCIPVLEEMSGLKAGEDFFVGYSPERINPGDKTHTFTTITKVVGAQSEEVLEIVADVYSSVVEAGVHKASSIKVAEASKVIENTQRDLNIALMNELALIFDRIGIDTTEVLEAAGTKWNFLPFKPGLVGGHCIGVDPYYLTHKSSTLGYIPQVILTGRSINDEMGGFVAKKLIKAMIKENININSSVVTILGLTFKENVPDLRNTRVVDIINELESYDITVQVNDPFASKDEALKELKIQTLKFDQLVPADAVILAVPHTRYVQESWTGISNLLKANKGVVFDIKSVLDIKSSPEDIILLRL
jgi:UDP-N-acetyl-D-galactosamine dehydrogenase